ncbi:MAG: dockerin type I repeat-containing protein [Oscillospiraceae bacterium]|nr:dockerin type I repeat-containing protein [Oscillospiraceae bacterium]
MMKKRLFAFLTALCCVSSMAGLPVGAYDRTNVILGNADVVWETEDALYLSDGRLYSDLEQTRSCFIVTGVYCIPGETEPIYYTVSPSYYADTCLLSTKTIREQLTEGSAMPEYGDILSCDITGTLETFPGQICFSDDSGCITNLGNGVSVLGEGFHQVISHRRNDFMELKDPNGQKLQFTMVGTEDEVPTLELIVIGIDEENPQNYVVCDPNITHSYYLPQNMVQQYSAGGTQPAYGDVLLFSGDYYVEPSFGLTTTIGFLGDGAITVEDSIFEEAVYESYTVNHVSDVDVLLTDANDRYASCCMDFTDRYRQPDGIDWRTVQRGDTVTFLTWEGAPVLPTAISRLGDANADGDVSIVDVVMVNRHVMGADMTSTTMNTDAADFDKNGEVTHEDSLSILKRLVGLV